MCIEQNKICNKMKQNICHELMQELCKIIDVSYKILDNLEKAGHPFKRLSCLVLEEREYPVWKGESETHGIVHIDPFKHDARAVAHEMGHGFEERYRKKPSEVMGESMAEAIRYFVEDRMGNSQWTPPKDYQVVLKMCEYDFEKFKKLLDSEDIHKKY